MLIDIKNNSLINYDNFVKYSLNKIDVYYKGIFFLRGEIAGECSIKKLLTTMEATHQVPYEDMMGSFCMIINSSDDILALTDNSHLQGMYISEGYISDNIFDLIDVEKNLELDRSSICEFLRVGQCFFNKTLLKNVKLTDSNFVYHITSGKLEIINKSIPDINGIPDIGDFKELYSDIAYALKNYEISLALTGGFDSRMVFVLLKNGVKLNTCISGDNTMDRDVQLSAKVAECAKINHEILEIKKPTISNDYLKHMFIDRGGCPAGFSDTDIRIYEMLKKRKKEGYNIHITGDTGVLYKDEHWIQDFPFYKKKNFDAARFYRQRIRMTNTSIPFSDEMKKVNRDIEGEIVKWLDDNKQEYNTKSYDWYRYNFKHETGMKHDVMMKSNLIDFYCPLMERKSVRFAYNMKRRDRLGAKAMKVAITNADINCARIPTWTGVTASSETKYILRDLYFNIINYFKKVFRLIGRKLLNKTFLTAKVITWTAEPEIRNLDIVAEAIKYFKDNNIFRSDCSVSDCTYEVLGRILYIYFLSESITEKGI